MAKKNRFDYFDAFEKQAEIAVEAADLLVKVVENFTTAKELRPILDEAHAIEQRGDDVDHDILHSVAMDFVTPIDRQDIIDLAQRLDSVTDDIESLFQRFYMYDIHDMHPTAIEFARLIKASTEALLRAMGDFRNFKHSDQLRDLVEEVNTNEEKADVLYLTTIRKLYTDDRERVMRVEVWTRIFDRMEATCDACEHVGDTMSDIVLKNM